jgi:DNA primase
MIPVRDGDDQVIGIYGRDATGQAASKYLNTPDTVAFNKGHALYRPSRPTLNDHVTVIVCEGSLDALAIAAEASAAGLSSVYAPVSPSGTALTSHQAKAVLCISGRPPVIAADGDPAGLAAGAKWAEMVIRMGRETLATILPHGLDPADWLVQHSANGLAAFTRPGRLAEDAPTVRPVPAGALLAEAQCAELLASGIEPESKRDLVIHRIVQLGAYLPSADARQRFAVAATRVLAKHDLGPDDWLIRKMCNAMTAQQGAALDHDHAARVPL